MHRMLATTLLVGGLVVATVATPAGAHWMADSGAFSADTGNDDSDTGGAANDTGSADTGSADTGSNAEVTAVYSAAELANDKGGCSTAGGTHTPWMATLIGVLLGFRRRRRQA